MLRTSHEDVAWRLPIRDVDFGRRAPVQLPESVYLNSRALGGRGHENAA